MLKSSLISKRPWWICLSCIVQEFGVQHRGKDSEADLLLDSRCCSDFPEQKLLVYSRTQLFRYIIFEQVVVCFSSTPLTPCFVQIAVNSVSLSSCSCHRSSGSANRIRRETERPLEHSQFCGHRDALLARKVLGQSRDQFVHVFFFGVFVPNRLKVPNRGPQQAREARYSWGGGGFFYLQLELFCLQLSFFAYSPLRPLLDALSPIVSKEGKTVSKKAPTVSRKAKMVNCK